MSSSRHYRGFNRHIISECCLPGAVPFDALSPVPKQSLFIRVGEIPQGKEVRRHNAYALRQDGVTIQVEGVAEFWCSTLGDEIRVAKNARASDSLVSRYLVANALPTACWLQRRQVFHAASAVLPGRETAMVICGQSGVGKSSLLLNLLAHGAAVVSEDVSVVDPAIGQFKVSGLSGEIQQRTPPLWNQDTRTSIKVPMARQMEKAYIGPILELVPESVWTGGPLRRLDTVAALTALLRNRYRANVPMLTGTESDHLASLACLAASVPIYSCSADLARNESAFSILKELASRV